MNRFSTLSLSIAATVIAAHALVGITTGTALQQAADVAVMPIVKAEPMTIRPMNIVRAKTMTVRPTRIARAEKITVKASAKTLAVAHLA